MAWRLGIDIGGTFTDVALVNDVDGTIGIAKPTQALLSKLIIVVAIR
jgi:N-methylhydantoinase A/oxoprolinase/acetone carboxylase beta subunit